jgi:hypothetical protein
LILWCDGSSELAPFDWTHLFGEHRQFVEAKVGVRRYSESFAFSTIADQYGPLGSSEGL